MSKETINLVMALKRLGMSQYEIAKKCNVSWRTISLWESGQITHPRKEKIEKLKEILTEEK